MAHRDRYRPDGGVPLRREPHPCSAVAYTYTVEGRAYRGEREHFGLRVATTGCLAGYTSGQSVPVYYHPHDPAQAVLRPQATEMTRFGLLVGAVFVAFGGGGYLYNRRHGAKKHQAGEH